MEIDAYYHDGLRLVRVLESDPSGALAEDAASYEWIEIDGSDVEHWTVVPRAEAA